MTEIAQVRIRKFLEGVNATVLLLLHERNEARYTELTRLARSRSTLSTVLKELEEERLLKRTVVSTRPFQVSYSLTERGKRIATGLRGIKKELEA